MSALFAALAYLFMVAAGVEMVDARKTDLPPWVYRLAFVGVLPLLVAAAAVSLVALLTVWVPVASGHAFGKMLRERWD